MKTSDLIEALAAADGGAVRPLSPIPRLVPAALAGAAVSLGILALWLGFQPLAGAAQAPWFWMKWGYGAAAAGAGLALAIPLSRPGGQAGRAGFTIAAVAIAAIWLMAIRKAMNVSPEHQLGLWLGHTWMACPWRILALATPIWLAAMMVMRRLAPTRLALAGTAAGILGGGLAIMIYGLYCEETAAPFVAVWYSLGIALCAGAGALAGPRLLRW